MKEITKLKNRYTGEIVFCRDIKKVIHDNSYTFVQVYREELPGRIYLVNLDAYIILTK
jgi:hypothetical protein